ncbi:LysM domain/BON superfamily protein [Roseovarius albus]|uniref:LysM domain/BON superfamily protein n=2 Tax=Roseovarius albus TaxID=1247867 RepID=A0A1X7A0J7_9RHOB|nr:LysM domain/BON superfamily protein [Roseovarius albus]
MAQKSGFPGGMVLGFAVAAAIALAVLSAVSFFSANDSIETAQDVEVLETAGSTEDVTAESAQAEAMDVVDDTGPVPEISTFLLNPDGQMLLAGRAPEGWEVSVLLDGEPIASFEPGAGGEFAEFLELDGSNETRVLSLAMTSPDSGEVVQSHDEVIITELADADITSRDDASINEKTVLLSNETGVTVLKAPSEEAPEVMANVALDAISYSDEGEVQLSGRASGEGFVRVYLDNAPLTLAPIEADGSWQSDLAEIDTGIYTLRVDELDAEGNVTSRVESPFKREEQAFITQTTSNGEKVRVITVQPGNTLWAISNAAYGDGYAYIRVFEANRDRIRNPDLIYPGQVFSVPE